MYQITLNRRGERDMFRDVMTGKLNREYLRICAVYSLLKKHRIGRAQAIELLAQRRVEKPERLVELWAAHPFKQIGILP